MVSPGFRDSRHYSLDVSFPEGRALAPCPRWLTIMSESYTESGKEKGEETHSFSIKAGPRNTFISIG